MTDEEFQHSILPPGDADRLLYIKARFALQHNGRRVQYDAGLYDKATIPDDHLSHPYFKAFVAAIPDDPALQIMREPRELPPLRPTPPNQIENLRNKEAYRRHV